MEGMKWRGGTKTHLVRNIRGVIYTALCDYFELRGSVILYPDIDLENPPIPICKNCLRIHQARKGR